MIKARFEFFMFLTIRAIYIVFLLLFLCTVSQQIVSCIRFCPTGVYDGTYRNYQKILCIHPDQDEV